VRAERLSEPILQDLATQNYKTPTQILLRWSLQKGFCPVVESDNEDRIEENFQIFDFELSAIDVARLDALDMGKKGACSWNPVDCD